MGRFMKRAVLEGAVKVQVGGDAGFSLCGG